MGISGCSFTDLETLCMKHVTKTNKRPMGHIVHLKDRSNHWTYLHKAMIIPTTLIKRKKNPILLFENWMVSLFVFKKNECPSPKDALCYVWLKLARCMVLKKKMKIHPSQANAKNLNVVYKYQLIAQCMIEK